MQTNITMESEKMAKRKSVALDRFEWLALKRLVKRSLTKIECAEALGIKRQVLDKVLLTGTASPQTIESIREALASQK